MSAKEPSGDGKSETPRTDAAFIAAFSLDEENEPYTNVSEIAAFTRSLERSLAAKEAEVVRLREWRRTIITSGWLTHFEHCRTQRLYNAEFNDCGCGLDAALSGGSS